MAKTFKFDPCGGDVCCDSGPVVICAAKVTRVRDCTDGSLSGTLLQQFYELSTTTTEFGSKNILLHYDSTDGDGNLVFVRVPSTDGITAELVTSPDALSSTTGHTRDVYSFWMTDGSDTFTMDSSTCAAITGSKLILAYRAFPYADLASKQFTVASSGWVDLPAFSGANSACQCSFNTTHTVSFLSETSAQVIDDYLLLPGEIGITTGTGSGVNFRGSIVTNTCANATRDYCRASLSMTNTRSAAPGISFGNDLVASIFSFSGPNPADASNPNFNVTSRLCDVTLDPMQPLVWSGFAVVSPSVGWCQTPYAPTVTVTEL